jgi:hypothetical protein
MQVNDDVFAGQDDTHILHPSSRALFRFWEIMRAENAAPSRDSLDLGLIRQLIPYLFIGEYLPQARMYRWRLAGTGICDLYCGELTGKDMLAGWDTFEHDIIARFLSGTVETRQPSVLRFRLTTDRDQVIGAELMALPIVAADGRTIHLFGGLFPFREIWSLGYSSLKHYELSSARHIWTETRIPAANPPAAAAPARRNFQVISGGLSSTGKP